MWKFELKGYNLKDTIAAIATFPSKSALGVIKISGKKSIVIISKIFRPARKKDIKKARTYTVHYGWIIETPAVLRRSLSRVKSRDPERAGRRSSVIVDEVLINIMRQPRSYTREDIVEISSHGGVIGLNKILELVLKEGARLALPGEFTYRALVRGRIDLFQAESILGIVGAKTERALVLASSQLKGEVSRKIKELKEEIKKLFVLTESSINFPEEDIRLSLPSIRKKIENLEERTNVLLKGSNEARIIREGLMCVICGKTNAGKSTLFNYLLKEERVIISKIPGTTRDVIEETINVRGVPLRIYDTAGILEPKDLITKRAMEKTSQVFDEADLAILVFDSSRVLDKDDFFLLEKARGKNTILVINKIDLPQRMDLEGISNVKGKACLVGRNKKKGVVLTGEPKLTEPRPFFRKVKMSALKKTGLKSLEKAICDSVYKEGLDKENIIFLGQYQQHILRKISDEIKKAKLFLEEGHTIDFVNLSLKDSLENLGRLSGEVFSEEILESIFSQFCIGK